MFVGFFVSVIVIILVVGFLFLQFSPQFGGRPNQKELDVYSTLENYEKGKFINLIPTSMDMNFSTFISILKDQFSSGHHRAPQNEIISDSIDSLEIEQNAKTRITWFGHSAVLLEMDGLKIFIDPMLGKVPAPHPWLGKNRFVAELPLDIEQIPPLDAVIISHDHYDHLDYESIQKLKQKVERFYVPLGVDAHLLAWGVEKERIESLNWWDETELGSVKLVFAPSRHFSGRGVSDRNKSLWGSWVLLGQKNKIYFSGDGGYGPHFQEIGEKYGPFDFAMLECGQYDDRWSEIHMMPEESAQAGKDVQAKVVMPIHWGAFVLAFHDWTDPVERFITKSNELEMQHIAPRIGQVLEVDSLKTDLFDWWSKYQ